MAMSSMLQLCRRITWYIYLVKICSLDSYLNLFADQIGEKRGPGLSSYELKTIQRILLEMLCQYELSSHFRTLPSRESNKIYFDSIRK